MQDLATGQRAEYGSVEYYRAIFGQAAAEGGGLGSVDGLVLNFVADVANAPFHEGIDRLARIRSVLAAAELVRDEIRASWR